MGLLLGRCVGVRGTCGPFVVLRWFSIGLDNFIFFMKTFCKDLCDITIIYLPFLVDIGNGVRT